MNKIKYLLLLILSFSFIYNSYSQDNEVTTEEVLLIAEEMPEFPGGDAAMFKYIAEQTIYPPQAIVDGIQGKVYVGFVVDKFGKIREINIARGVDTLLDNEAIRVVKTFPDFVPGKNKGEAVNVKLLIPIIFKINAINIDSLTTNRSYPEFKNLDVSIFDWIQYNVKYPEEAINNEIEGIVHIRFAVETDGSISNTQIVSGVNNLLDSAALKVIDSLPELIPATKNNKLIKMWYNVPVYFELKKTITITQNEDNEIDTLYIVSNELARFPGGEEALRALIAENIKYPLIAIEENIQGKVYVGFVVNKDGSIGEISIVKSVHPIIDFEAARVIAGLPNFQPGYQKGVSVRVWYTLPIDFQLSGLGTKKTKKVISKQNIADTPPKFPEGKEAMYEYIYKRLASYGLDKNNYNNDVFVEFSVNKDGDIQNIEFAEDTHFVLKYYLYLILYDMPPFTPAKKGKRKVNAWRGIILDLNELDKY